MKLKPSEKKVPSKSGLLVVAEFLAMMVFLRLTATPLLRIPPPVTLVLFETVVFVRVNLPFGWIPPL